MEMTREQLARKIADEISCTAKVWAKGEKVRVYLSHKGKDYGFVEIKKDGVDWSLTSYGNNTYGGEIRSIVKGIEINEPDSVIPGTRRLTADEVDALAAAPRKDHRDDTTKALDAMYGRGGWDRWDREDYEG